MSMLLACLMGNVSEVFLLGRPVTAVCFEAGATWINLYVGVTDFWGTSRQRAYDPRS